jgi:hypothetical protein
MLTEGRIYSMHLQKRVNNGFKKKVLVYLLIVLSWSPAYNGEEKKYREQRGRWGVIFCVCSS